MSIERLRKEVVEKFGFSENQGFKLSRKGAEGRQELRTSDQLKTWVGEASTLELFVFNRYDFGVASSQSCESLNQLARRERSQSRSPLFSSSSEPTPEKEALLVQRERAIKIRTPTSSFSIPLQEGKRIRVEEIKKEVAQRLSLQNGFKLTVKNRQGSRKEITDEQLERMWKSESDICLYVQDSSQLRTQSSKSWESLSNVKAHKTSSLQTHSPIPTLVFSCSDPTSSTPRTREMTEQVPQVIKVYFQSASHLFIFKTDDTIEDLRKQIVKKFSMVQNFKLMTSTSAKDGVKEIKQTEDLRTLFSNQQQVELFLTDDLPVERLSFSLDSLFQFRSTPQISKVIRTKRTLSNLENPRSRRNDVVSIIVCSPSTCFPFVVKKDQASLDDLKKQVSTSFGFNAKQNFKLLVTKDGAREEIQNTQQLQDLVRDQSEVKLHLWNTWNFEYSSSTKGMNVSADLTTRKASSMTSKMNEPVTSVQEETLCTEEIQLRKNSKNLNKDRSSLRRSCSLYNLKPHLDLVATEEISERFVSSPRC